MFGSNIAWLNLVVVAVNLLIFILASFISLRLSRFEVELLEKLDKRYVLKESCNLQMELAIQKTIKSVQHLVKEEGE